jgi:hypothetical protein
MVVLLACVSAAVVARGALGATPLPPNGVPNGTYAGYNWATNTAFSAVVKSNSISGAAFFTQLFNGTPGQLIPGWNTSYFGSIDGSPQGSPGSKIAANGSWVLSSGLMSGEGSGPTICGDTKYQKKLVVSWNCTGPGGTMVGNPQFSAQTTSTPGIADGVYSGKVNTSAVADDPSAPWTGTTGTLTLVVADDTVSGSGTLAPVDPQTGVITGPPNVNVAYGPVPVGGGTGGNFIASSGQFNLISTPAGYNIGGGFVPAGIPGLPSNGMVAGTINTFTPTGAEGSLNYGPALPGSFQIFGAGS